MDDRPSVGRPRYAVKSKNVHALNEAVHLDTFFCNILDTLNQGLFVPFPVDHH